MYQSGCHYEHKKYYLTGSRGGLQNPNFKNPNFKKISRRKISKHKLGI